MTMALNLAYGAETISFHIPQRADILKANDPAAAITPAIFKQRLTAFLQETALDLTSVVIVVADKTRLCGYPEYLPVLVDILKTAGADIRQLKLFIAYGTHPRQSDPECYAAYGPMYDRHTWIHHNCADTDAFTDLGRTPRDTPVRLRTDILEAGCVITFGAISHHYFAGYGGGRKLIFPGLGEKAAIYANHGLFLDRATRRLSARCLPGVLADNPLAEDLADIETHRPADMAIHGILDSGGQLCDLLVGRGGTDFEDACQKHGNHFEIHSAQYDLVLASCHGFPKDINFIQSHKTIHNAAAFVKDGGQLIVLAQCKDGIGSQTFLPWFAMGDWTAAFNQLAEHYEGNGGTALAMMEKLQRIRIGLVTELDKTRSDTIGLERLSVEQVQHRLDAHQGSMAVIPNAAVLVGKT